MQSELKPCPFCGGTNLKTGGDDKVVGVWCQTCQAAGPNHYGSHEWNDRDTCKVCGGDTARYDFDPQGCACVRPAENLRRHSMVFDGEEGWIMLPDPDGEYVKFEDVSLTAALSAEQTQPVAVKALEWRQLYPEHSKWPKDWHGTGVQRTLYVVTQSYASGDFHVCGRGFDSLQEAKLYAQSDYETRIRSALVDAPAEPVAWQPRYKQSVIDHHRSIGSDLWEYAMTIYPTKAQAEGYGYRGHEARALYTCAVVIPADPTDAMIDAALAVDWECEGNERGAAINVWYAMYSTALAATRSGSATTASGASE